MHEFIKIGLAAESIMVNEFSLKESAESLCEIGGEQREMETGLTSLDEKLESFREGGLYAVGGRPGMGKTAFLIDIALNILASTQKTVYFVSADLKTGEFVRRMIPHIVNIPSRKINAKEFSASDNDMLKSCLDIMDSLDMYICDTAVNTDDICTLCSDNEIKDGILLIDGLHLTEGAVISDRLNASSALKLMAEKNRIPMVVSVNLTRKIEEREDKHPVLDDLKYNADMGNIADGVILIYREAYYIEGANDTAELIIAKNNYGTVGTACAKFDWERNSFSV